jgi:hypothetical protein
MKICTVAILAAVSCYATGGELLELYSKTVHPMAADSRSTPMSVWTGRTSGNHGISEIGIERVPGMGYPVEYTLIVRADGSVRFKGGEYMDPKGDQTGTVPMEEFNRVAWFIKDFGFMDLRDDYFGPATDQPTVYTTVTMNGKRKLIRDYAEGGPCVLWAVERLIDGCYASIKWNGTSKKEDKR